MSAFTKMQLRVTRKTVDFMRGSIDTVNSTIGFVTGPLFNYVNRITHDAPWIIILFTAMSFSSCPLIVYPYVKVWLLDDERARREVERVRLCLQKGIDPFPTIQHKDFVYGNVVPAFQTDTSHAPLESSWEHSAIVRYRQEKDALLKGMGTEGYDIDRSVAQLLKLREKLKAAHKEAKESFDLEPEGVTFGRREVNSMK
jgi:hypothetical protein